MLDITNGDVLVVGAKEYNIRFVGEWTGWGASASFRRMANVSASTKRAPNVSANQRGTPTTHLTGVSITPLDPLGNDLANRLPVEVPYTAKQCYCGDGTGFLLLIVEDTER